MEIKSGSYTALIGHTGSGKSTILQLLNGLLVPNQGSVEVGSTVITADSVNKDIKQVRKKVGLVFQFPESQVFDETVLKDVALVLRILVFLRKKRKLWRVKSYTWSGFLRICSIAVLSNFLVARCVG